MSKKISKPAAVNPLFAAFKTSNELETKGITLLYPGLKLEIARAGGANKAFGKLLDTRLKPYERQMRTNSMDDAVAARIMAEVYAETIVLSCAVESEGEYLPDTCPTASGEVVPATRDALADLFTELPELFRDIQAQASNFALFREAELAETAGN